MSGISGLCRTPVTGKGKIIELFTAERPLVSHALSRLALTGQFVSLSGHPAEGFAMNLAVATHGYATHVLCPAGDHYIDGAGSYGACGNMHRDFSRATFTVDS